MEPTGYALDRKLASDLDATRFVGRADDHGARIGRAHLWRASAITAVPAAAAASGQRPGRQRQPGRADAHPLGIRFSRFAPSERIR